MWWKSHLSVTHGIEFWVRSLFGVLYLCTPAHLSAWRGVFSLASEFAEWLHHLWLYAFPFQSITHYNTAFTTFIMNSVKERHWKLCSSSCGYFKMNHETSWMILIPYFAHSGVGLVLDPGSNRVIHWPQRPHRLQIKKKCYCRSVVLSCIQTFSFIIFYTVPVKEHGTKFTVFIYSA